MTALPFRRLLTSLLCLAALGQSHPASALGLLPAYEAALANDPAYRAALQESEAGQEYRVLGRSHLLPSLTANYSTSKNQGDVTTATLLGERTEPRKYTSSAASIQLRQPLLHLEGMARYRQGEAQSSASDAQFLVRSQDLIVRLVSLYASAKYAEDQLAQAIAQRDAYAEQRQSNVRLFQRGEGTRTEVLETQAKFDLSEAQVLEARDSLTNARNALAAMVGQDIDRLDPLVDDFQVRPLQPASFEAWKELALANNPEVIAQRYAVEVASEEINKNRAGHWPRLDLIASVSNSKSDTTSTFNQDTNNRSIGVQLNVPLYAGGSVSAATRQAVANHEKARADLDAKTSQVLVELRKQYNLTQSSVLRIDAAAKSLSSALLLVDATQKSVKGGQRTNLDVLNAQQQLFEARRDLALSRYNYLLGYLRLRYSAGTLARADLQDVAGYFVREN
ncbi:TolC family outer membrane protein [Polaromonas sp.]|uniref:TolC family outer membrane protein n=1 Tax=Polaromonas sp. TaxID=1869339 RepID=UPI00286B8821|nr:TolC family outer membrane protein [Polaromonas sp.]